MFDELQKLIKPDQATQARFLQIKKEFHDRRTARDKKLLRKARQQAIILGSFTVISLMFLIYAFRVETIAENELQKLESEITLLNTKLEACQ